MSDSERRPQHSVFVAHLPGWMFMVSGMVLVAAALLAPAWREGQRMKWQLDLMSLQADALVKQGESYHQFHEALASDDPVLLERLAYLHLRLKPAGTETLDTQAAAQWLMDARENNRTGAFSIEAMLHQPLPRAGVDYPVPDPPQSRLVRLTTGTYRLAILLVGGLCLAVGLMPPTIPEDEPVSMAPTEPAIPLASGPIAPASDEEPVLVAELDES
jgi:hypothetical protein